MVETVSVLSILQGAMLDEARGLWTLFKVESGSKGVALFDHPNSTLSSWAKQDLHTCHLCHRQTTSNFHLVQLDRNSGRIEVIQSYAPRR